MNNFGSDLEKLKEEHERLWLVLRASQLGLWDWDMTSGIVEIDERWAEMLGYELVDLLPFNIDKFFALSHPDDLERVDRAIHQHTKNETPFYQVEIRLQNKNGKWAWVKSTGMIAQRDETGKPLRMTGVHEDVTEVANQRIQGEIARTQLETAQRLGGLGSWYLDLETDRVTWSDELFRMQGLAPDVEPPPASTHHQLFSPHSWEMLSNALGETISSGKPYELELEMFNNGKFHGWMLARGEAIRSPEGQIVGVLGVALDITQRKSRETELRKRALLDPLCQLGNRAAFDISLVQAYKTAQRAKQGFALVMIDIDHFKSINDIHGHEVGDRALVQVGERLRATLRGDDQIFRVGGDEFIVLLANSMSAEKAAEISERIVFAFRRPLLQLKEPLTATVSVGLVLWNGSETATELVKRADEALYTAKESGRNQLFCPEI